MKCWAYLVAQRPKNPPSSARDVGSILGWGRSCKRKWQPTQYCAAWEIQWMEGPGGYSPWGLRVGHNLATETTTAIWNQRWVNTLKQNTMYCDSHFFFQFTSIKKTKPNQLLCIHYENLHFTFRCVCLFSSAKYFKLIKKITDNLAPFYK